MRILLLVIAFCMIVIGVQAQSQQFADHNITFQYPDGWEVDQSNPDGGDSEQKLIIRSVDFGNVGAIEIYIIEGEGISMGMPFVEATLKAQAEEDEDAEQHVSLIFNDQFGELEASHFTFSHHGSAAKLDGKWYSFKTGGKSFEVFVYYLSPERGPIDAVFKMLHETFTVVQSYDTNEPYDGNGVRR